MQGLVTAAVINYQTPDLLTDAVRSFRKYYRDVPLIVVENGSMDDSFECIKTLQAAFPDSITLIRNAENLYHGPAMDQAIRSSKTPFVYVFDSDTRTKSGGFLEAMTKMMTEDSMCYAVGKIVTVNRRGFAATAGTPVPVSAFMLIRKEKYELLAPFEHHGLPVLKNCIDAARNGWRICSYPVEEYVEHFGRGTADRYGYGLGWRSRIDYLLNRLGL